MNRTVWLNVLIITCVLGVVGLLGIDREERIPPGLIRTWERTSVTLWSAGERAADRAWELLEPREVRLRLLALNAAVILACAGFLAVTRGGRRERMERMAARGVSVHAIARKTGLAQDVVRAFLDPGGPEPFPRNARGRRFFRAETSSGGRSGDDNPRDESQPDAVEPNPVNSILVAGKARGLHLTRA